MKTITLDDYTLDYLQNTIWYYEHHKVDNLTKNRPQFVIDDFENLLNKLNELLKEV